MKLNILIFIIVLFVVNKSDQKAIRVLKIKRISKSLKNKFIRRKQDIQTNIPTTPSQKYTLPDNLTDGNQDGTADEGDFIRSFANVGLSPWELKQLFLMVDTSGNGSVDGNEWRNFHDMFIAKFTASDKNSDLYLNKDELINSFADMVQMTKIFNDNQTVIQLLNDISGRQDRNNPGLNFFEWMFVRRCAIAFGISNSQQVTISKTELFDSALVIMLPFNQHDGQLKNQIYSALNFEDAKTQFQFIDMANLFHKFLIWSSMTQHSSIHGSVSKNLLLKCIDDGIGPSEIFLVQGESKAGSISQAFSLISDGEETGLDFQNFFVYMQVLYSVKFNALTFSGALTLQEFRDTMNKDSLFVGTNSYIQNSYVMSGNYQKGINFTIESEAHHLSKQKFQPIQVRFLQNSNQKKNFRLKLLKKKTLFGLKKQDDNEEEEKKDDKNNSLNMDLKKDPYIYFFNTFRSNGNDSLINAGDVFRIKKYQDVVGYWDNSQGPQSFAFYPELLEFDHKHVLPGAFFLREKEIISEIISIYKELKDLDQVQQSLPMDLLGFSRFMCYDGLQISVTKSKVGEEISYTALHQIFQRMGLIPYNLDLNDWLKDVFQGQRGFKIYNQTAEILQQGRKIVDGRQQMILASIRASKQRMALNQFQNSESYIDHVQYNNANKLPSFLQISSRHY